MPAVAGETTLQLRRSDSYSAYFPPLKEMAPTFTVNGDARSIAFFIQISRCSVFDFRWGNVLKHSSREEPVGKRRSFFFRFRPQDRRSLCDDNSSVMALPLFSFQGRSACAAR